MNKLHTNTHTIDTYLDTASNTNIVNDPSLLHNISYNNNRYSVTGIGGNQTSTTSGSFGLFGNAILISTIPINIISYSQIKKNKDFNIEYNSKLDFFSLTHYPSKSILKFHSVMGFYKHSILPLLIFYRG